MSEIQIKSFLDARAAIAELAESNKLNVIQGGELYSTTLLALMNFFNDRLSFASLDEAGQIVTPNLINSLQHGFGEFAPNAAFKPTRAFDLAAANNVVYTCPAGKRAAINTFTFKSTNGANQNVAVKLDRAGTLYRLNPNIAVNANNVGTLTAMNYLLEPGEKLVIVPTLGNIHATFCPVEFDVGSPFRSISITNFVVGDNAVYQVPANKVFRVPGLGLSMGLFSVGGSCCYTNDTAGAITVYFALVPSGQASDPKHAVLASTSVAAAGALTTAQFGVVPHDGDQMILNSSSNAAGQFAWATGFLLDL